MKEKLEQFTTILNTYNSASKETGKTEEAYKKEKFVAEKIKKDLEWNRLNDDQKQQFRLQKVMYMLDWITQKGEDPDQCKHEQLLCIWDEHLYATINALEELMESETDPVEQELLFRLFAMFLAEKHLLNAEREFVLKPVHNDYYVMMTVMGDFANSKYAEKLGVNNLRQLFHDMYRHWERRPYREVV